MSELLGLELQMVVSWKRKSGPLKELPMLIAMEHLSSPPTVYFNMPSVHTSLGTIAMCTSSNSIGLIGRSKI